MPLISSTMLLYAHSATLLTIAYLLLTNPAAVLSSSPLWLMGESMHIQPASFAPSLASSSTRALKLDQSARELLALTAFILTLGALTQAIFAGTLHSSIDFSASSSSTKASSSSLGEKVATLRTSQTTHLLLSTVRTFVPGLLVGYIYLLHADRSDGYKEISRAKPAAGLNLLANRVVFAAAMADMLFWGYLWTVLREEGREVADKVGRWQQREDEVRQQMGL